MLKSLSPFLLLASLTACGGGGDAAGDAATPSPAAPTQAAVASCDGLPAHAVLAADAKVSLCTHGETGPGHVSGTVIYTTGQSGDAILAWYKGKAAEFGLKEGVNTSAAFSATEGTKRSFMALVAPAEGGAGTQVTLNWGMDK